MTYTNKIDTSLPAGSDDPAEADDNMRRIQAGFQEILAVEHNVDLTGTEITGDATHKDITPDSVTSAGPISGTNITASGTLGVAGVATVGDASALATDAAPTEDKEIVNKKYVDDYVGSSYRLISVEGSPVKVYTKYLADNLASAATTNVAHGVVDSATKILMVSTMVYDDTNSAWITPNAISLGAVQGYQISVNATNIVFGAVGANLQGHRYVVKVDYIL